jgi:hypothetical protein
MERSPNNSGMEFDEEKARRRAANASDMDSTHVPNPPHMFSTAAKHSIHCHLRTSASTSLHLHHARPLSYAALQGRQQNVCIVGFPRTIQAPQHSQSS